MTAEIEEACRDYIRRHTASDSAHDFLHVERVVTLSRQIGDRERADLTVVIPASWLHDCVTVSKGSHEREGASRLAAREATRFLASLGVPDSKIEKVAHCIEAHSFSAGISPQTLEARVVQDADRLDALGAIGLARCFATSGILNRPLYQAEDPFCELRTPDDALSAIDHVYRKLIKLPDMLLTATAREFAAPRAAFIQQFVEQLRRELVSAGG